MGVIKYKKPARDEDGSRWIGCFFNLIDALARTACECGAFFKVARNWTWN